MTDPNGWPDADKPGVPLNPGAHVLRHRASGVEVVVLWDFSEWFDMQGGFSSVFAAEHYDYIGPCLTPAEVEAKVAAARNAALEEAASIADGRPSDRGEDCAAAIRALKETPND